MNVSARSAPVDAWLTPRRERWLLAAILAFALATRVLLALQLRSSPLFAEPGLDARFFVDWGLRVAGGEVVPDGPYPRAPLYAWWLGSVFHVLGDGLLAPRLLQAVLGTASIALVAWIGRELFSRAAGVLAAAVAALYWPLCWYDVDLVREPLAILLILGGLAWSASALRARARWRWWAAALVFGLAALVRPQVLVPALAVFVWATVSRRLDPRTCLVAILALFAPLAPVALHNLNAGAGLVLVSAEGGQALWIGNNPAADGITATAPGTRRGFEEQMVDARAQAEHAAGAPLRQAEVSRYWAGRATTWILENPGDALRLYARKLALLASGWEFGANPDEPAFFAQRFGPVTQALPLGFGALLALAAAGAWHALRPPGDRALLVWFGLAYAVTVVLVLVSARHRLPLTPLLAMFAGAGLVALIESANARRGRQIAVWVFVAALGWGASRLHAWPVEASRANGLSWIGMAKARAGEPLEGLRFLDEALALRPDFSELHRARGGALAKLARIEEARAAFAEAVRLAPTDVDALDGLAELEIRLARFASAAELAERSIAVAPHLARAWALRGRARYYTGDLAGAERDFRAALERDPRSFLAAYSLAAALAGAGRTAEAIDAFERALSNGDRGEAPFVRSAHEELIRLLSAAGRTAEAAAWGRRLAERRQDQSQ